MKVLSFIAALVALSHSGVGPDTDSPETKTDTIDSTVVSSSRAGEHTPVTFTTVQGEQLRQASPSSSLPMTLSLQPSVISFNEGGTGLGYSRMSVRGVRGSQINVTLNGVTLNDAETQEVFWVNIPALSSVLGSVQLQRGLGTSSSGTGAFGASVNMSTVSFNPEPFASVDLSAGSYGTFTGTVSAGTGQLPHGFHVEAAYSYNRTDGYIRNAFVRARSAYANVGWMNGSNSIRLTWLMGRQRSGITWEGISPEQYAADRRYNPAGEYVDSDGNVRYYDNETDNFMQNHIQANYTHIFSPSRLDGSLAWSTTFNYTRGDGYYDQFIDGASCISGVSNNLYVLNSDLKLRSRKVDFTGGVSLSSYDCDHFGNVGYRNLGVKDDFAVYARMEGRLGRVTTGFVDLQGRFVRLHMDGEDIEFIPLDCDEFWPFFNPRGGFTFNWSGHHKAYASAAYGHREPGRSDIKNMIVSASAPPLRPEKMLDAELGYQFTSPCLNASAGLYLMRYFDMLIETGKIDEVGYMVKENIPDAFRAGMEQTVSWMPLDWLDLSANLTLSLNRYAVEGGMLPLLMSPSVMSMLRAQFKPWRTLRIAADARFVGRQFLDNTGNDAFIVPAYYVCNIEASYTFNLRRAGSLTISGYVNNFTNHLYYADGWCYDGAVGVYPQAPANFIFRVGWRL